LYLWLPLFFTVSTLRVMRPSPPFRLVGRDTVDAFSSHAHISFEFYWLALKNALFYHWEILLLLCFQAERDVGVCVCVCVCVLGRLLVGGAELESARSYDW
jgi:hypothetical protein